MGENREKKLPTLDLHVDGGNGAKTIVYNTKRDSKKGDGKKIQERKESKRWKKYNSKKGEFFIIDHTDWACPRMLFACVHV